MEKTIIKVEGMSCEHCVKAVTNAVNSVTGIGSVSVDLAEKTVTVEYDAAKTSLESIETEIENQGYDVIG